MKSLDKQNVLVYKGIMKAQTALKKMPLTYPETHSIRGCVGLAIAVRGSGGKFTADFAKAVENYLDPYKIPVARNEDGTYNYGEHILPRTGKVKKGEHYGIHNRTLHRLFYDEFGLKFKWSDPDRKRFPRTAILWLRSKTNPKSCHIVARIKGVLYDSFDCRNDEDAYDIIGYWA